MTFTHDLIVKLAFIGASGYGNTGDATYPLVLREQLAEHELIFYNSDLPAELPSDLDAMVLGGGGLIYNSGVTPASAESHHFQCMCFYMRWAKQRGIPWGFLSCGVQLRREHEDNVSEVLAPWIPWLREARFISLRSPACVKVVAEITGRGDIHFFPDLAYLFRPPAPKPPEHRTMTFVIGGSINPREIFCKHLVRQFQAAGCRIVWLSMGAEVDDGRSIADVRSIYPKHGLIPTPTPAEAWQQIAASYLVVSGRYHGMVFARTADVPFFVPQEAPWKIRKEIYGADIRDASGHLRLLRESLAGAGSPVT
jgi:hypothetical protein